MLDVSADETKAKPAIPATGVAENTQQFLGISEDGKQVFLEFAGKEHALVRKQ